MGGCSSTAESSTTMLGKLTHPQPIDPESKLIENLFQPDVHQQQITQTRDVQSQRLMNLFFMPDVIGEYSGESPDA
jgi:hypothetical protein